jgi:hypothetical protein
MPENISTVTSKFPNSQNYVAMVFTDQDVKIVKSQIKFFPTSTSPDQIGIYPLKTGPEAWQDLNNGRAYIISSTPGVTDITIKKAFLAYYDPDIYQPYLQPVYVFIGQNNFVGFVPAVQNDLLLK